MVGVERDKTGKEEERYRWRAAGQCGSNTRQEREDRNNRGRQAALVRCGVRGQLVDCESE